MLWIRCPLEGVHILQILKSAIPLLRDVLLKTSEILVVKKCFWQPPWEEVEVQKFVSAVQTSHDKLSETEHGGQKKGHDVPCPKRDGIQKRGSPPSSRKVRGHVFGSLRISQDLPLPIPDDTLEEGRCLQADFLVSLVSLLSLRHHFWRVPNTPGANHLIAERAFSASDYWGLMRVSDVQGR